jgi:hypothetical protein
MTIDEAITVLELHNMWRKGADIEMQSPTKIGMAIDMVLCELKGLRKEQSAKTVTSKEKDEWIKNETIDYDWKNDGFGDETIIELLERGYNKGYNDAMKIINNNKTKTNTK